MIEEKGLPIDVADLISGYVKLHGGKDLVDRLSHEDKLCSQSTFKSGLDELKLLLEYCEVIGVLDKVYGWMDVWMDGWMEGWMDGWMDGSINLQTNKYLFLSLVIIWS